MCQKRARKIFGKAWDFNLNIVRDAIGAADAKNYHGRGRRGGGPGSPQKIGSRQIQACLVYIRSHSIVRDDILVSLAIRNLLWILQCYSHNNVVYGALFA